MLRALVLTVAAAGFAATGCAATDGPGGSEPAARTTPAPPVVSPVSARRQRALQVLRDWDAARARAFADADAGALAGLYAPGSGLAEQDLAVLRDYDRRGVRVTDLAHQVASTRVLISATSVVELAVVDRIGVLRVRAGGRDRALPASGYDRRVVRLQRVEGRWRVSSVRAA